MALLLPRGRSLLQGLMLLLAGTLAGPALDPVEAVCPSSSPRTGNPGGGSVPPGLREPFDPPPEEPEEDEPPEEPRDAPPPSAPPPAEPPPAKPAPTTPPAGSLPPPPEPPSAPTTTPRGKVAPRLPDVLDDGAWEFWWGLNRPDVLPRVRRQADSPDGAYDRELPPELRVAVDRLIEALADADPDVRDAAASAFAGFQTSYRAHDTLESLRRAAQGHDRWLRDIAHLALGLRRDAESLPPLRRVLLNRREEDVSRAFAALALIQLGSPAALADLGKLTTDLSEPEVAGCVLIGLGETRDPAHLPLLIEAARRHTGAAVRVRRVRADAITALGKLAHPATVAYLGELLGDQENAIARSAAIALGGFAGCTEAVGLLRRRGLGSEDPWVRALSALSLGRLHDATALPALARRVRSEDPVVRPFVTLGLGLLGDPGSARLLAEPLAEDPRTGAFASAALAAGLLGADEQRPLLASALGDTRTAAAPACGALGLGLLHATEVRSVLTARFWFDSTRARPGFAEALALLDAPAQSTWLLGQLARARRSGERQVLVEALGLCGGPEEGAVLATTFASAPKGDTRLRVRLVGALAGILRDHAVTPARRLLLHTYYLQPNDVLGHLAYLP